MTNIDPRDQDMMDSPQPAPQTRRTDGWPDDRVENGAGRNDFREDRTAPTAPVNYEPARSDRNGWSDNGEIPTRKVRETKPAFLTTEFWFAVGGIAALIAIYVIEDDPTLDLFRTALLATLIGVSYIVSRGLAKAGSRTTRQPEDPRLTAYDVR
jgi:hypothetical protein